MKGLTVEEIFEQIDFINSEKKKIEFEKKFDNKLLEFAEQTLKRIDGHKLKYKKSYDVSDIDASNFSEWYNIAKKTTEPDKIRNVLFFGFQPLYDAMINESINNNIRNDAHITLNKIIETSQKFIGSYYIRDPDVSTYLDDIKIMEENIEKIKDVSYKKKFRNIDYNGIYPEHIRDFISTTIKYIMGGKLLIPDVIVSVACGPSEISFALAEAVNTPLEFMRMSHRRGDGEAKMLPEDKNRMKEEIQGAGVLCVEDYVVSGNSLYYVMKAVKKMGSSNLQGLSVNGPDSSSYLKKINSVRKYNQWSMN